MIGGYTEPRGSREYFGALLAGLYDGTTLRFIAGVGTGFDQPRQAEIYKKLKKPRSDHSPFEPAPKTREKAQWIAPQMVASLKYANWTEDRRLRAPVFLALLDDHRPSDCQFKTETPVALKEALGGVKLPESGSHVTPRTKGKSSRAIHGQSLSQGSRFHPGFSERADQALTARPVQPEEHLQAPGPAGRPLGRLLEGTAAAEGRGGSKSIEEQLEKAA